MADQCIVCLENLDGVIPLQQLQGDEQEDSGSSSNSGPSGSSTNSDHHRPPPLPLASPTENTTTTTKDGNDSEDNIAVIQVCGHILHDTCLKAWTGKANSCPICRQAFHLVQVYDKIGGTSPSPPTQLAPEN